MSAGENFAAAAKQKGVEIHTSEPFSEDTVAEQFPNAPAALTRIAGCLVLDRFRRGSKLVVLDVFFEPFRVFALLQMVEPGLLVDDGGPLGLAMEDYVQRRAPGWAVIGGPFFEDEKLPASVEEQRRDLDKRIKEYEDHAKAFFGARRKR